MTKTGEIKVEGIDRLLHEPSRLAILTALCASPEPLSFTVLRDACGLTDGNLNRHLNALEEAGIIRIRKSFHERRPRTTVAVTGRGIERFQHYVDSLEAALRSARRALPDRGMNLARARTA